MLIKQDHARPAAAQPHIRVKVTQARVVSLPRERE